LQLIESFEKLFEELKLAEKTRVENYEEQEALMQEKV